VRSYIPEPPNESSAWSRGVAPDASGAPRGHGDCAFGCSIYNGARVRVSDSGEVAGVRSNCGFSAAAPDTYVSGFANGTTLRIESQWSSDAAA
jgi:hypothetical protein